MLPFEKELAVTASEILDISVEVANTARVSGDEVVQLHIRDEYASVPCPAKELKGYGRVMRTPGPTKCVTFHLPVDQLAFHDPDHNLILEPGKIDVRVGSSSEDIRLRGGLETKGDKSMAVRQRVLVCPVSIE